jgi:hypothetical protein
LFIFLPDFLKYGSVRHFVAGRGEHPARHWRRPDAGFRLVEPSVAGEPSRGVNVVAALPGVRLGDVGDAGDDLGCRGSAKGNREGLPGVALVPLLRPDSPESVKIGRAGDYRG